MFANRVGLKFYHTAWQAEGHWLLPGFPQNRLGSRPGGGGSGVHVVIRGFSLLVFLDRDFGTFSAQPGAWEAPWQPPGFPQNRPGRRPGDGGSGLHMVIRSFSWLCFSESFTQPGTSEGRW